MLDCPLTEFEQSMLVVVADLAEGEVISYADVAQRAGRPGASRAAGRFMAKAMFDLPWWRVVYSDGRLPNCNPPVQVARLQEEGVDIQNGRVVRSPLGRFQRSKSRANRPPS